MKRLAIGITCYPSVGGSGIVGVASDDEKDSIIVYNTRQKYNEWEFIAILGQQGQQSE